MCECLRARIRNGSALRVHLRLRVEPQSSGLSSVVKTRAFLLCLRVSSGRAHPSQLHALDHSIRLETAAFDTTYGTRALRDTASLNRPHSNAAGGGRANGHPVEQHVRWIGPSAMCMVAANAMLGIRLTVEQHDYYVSGRFEWLRAGPEKTSKVIWSRTMLQA